ncbi:RNA helicase HEL117 [Plectosphaerella plurivora]|uniref:RNA helicase HEL117 n=1 Tax=Plectosphaerella plurivora TaxID=936078 RepID=A0A9P9AGQ4_9PEZI|nr:RNA helicase HEL117 [Plectosphaerella plurivora]
MENTSERLSGHRSGDLDPRERAPRERISRSRSPRRRDHHERRSRSPRRHRGDRGDHRTRDRHDEGSRRKRHHKHSQPSNVEKPPANVALPYDARSLSKADYRPFLPLFAYYLDLQKEKDISEMDEREARGRWKSFIKKWNSGELSRSWYDPEMFATAAERMGGVAPLAGPGDSREIEPNHDEGGDIQRQHHRGSSQSGGNDNMEDDDDDMGPMLPPTSRSNAQKSGPGIPKLDDLATLRENRADEAREARQNEYADLRHDRKQDRKLQKERLEELAPRAEPGTRERRLEKKAAVNEKMKGFREKSPGGEVAEGELMGGGDGIDELKREKAANERRKTEREIRREEIARAKAEEREERVKEWREREEGTMKALKELAKQRFG